MKNIFRNAVVLLLICNCFILTAQTKKEMLIGSWVFDFEKATENMDIKAKEVLVKIPSAQNDLKKSYLNRRIVFSSDGNYVLLLANGNQTTGKWMFNNASEDSLTLTISEKAGNFDLILLSSSSLILKLRNQGSGKPMFSQWYFTKI